MWFDPSYPSYALISRDPNFPSFIPLNCKNSGNFWKVEHARIKRHYRPRFHALFGNESGLYRKRSGILNLKSGFDSRHRVE